MKKEDFHVEANGRGYMVYYKGKPIGGAGILPSAKGPRGRAVAAQVKDYFRMGNSTIAGILNGHGDKYMLDNIKKIDDGTN